MLAGLAQDPITADADAHLAMVAVNQQRVILAIEYEAQDGLHYLDRNVLFLCALHLENMVTDAICGHEGRI